MSRKQIVKAVVSVAGVAIGIAVYSQVVRGASAFPTTSLNVPYDVAPEGFGTYLYPSRVAATIFGADATDFDYHLASDNTAATEALAAYATAYASGDESQILISFLNATGAGFITDSQAGQGSLAGKGSDSRQKGRMRMKSEHRASRGGRQLGC